MLFAVERATEALNRGDVEACLLSHEPDVEIRFIGATGSGLAERYHGHEGFRALFADWKEGMDNPHWTIERVVDRGERIVIRYGFSGRGAASGVETDATLGYVLSMSARGKVARQDMYWDWSEALEAAGLRE